MCSGNFAQMQALPFGKLHFPFQAFAPTESNWWLTRAHQLLIGAAIPQEPGWYTVFNRGRGAFTWHIAKLQFILVLAGTPLITQQVHTAWQKGESSLGNKRRRSVQVPSPEQGHTPATAVSRASGVLIGLWVIIAPHMHHTTPQQPGFHLWSKV